MKEDQDTTQQSSGSALPLALGFAVLTVVIRLYPPLWHLTPLGALALFAGARLKSWQALLITLGTMLTADLLLWPSLARQGYSAFGWFTLFGYGSVLLYFLIGRSLTRTRSPLWIAGGCLLGGVLFFLVSNFGVWLMGDGVEYPQTLAGLLDCYFQGLPFFRGTVAGDVLFSFGIFGLYEAATHLARRRVKASQAA